MGGGQEGESPCLAPSPHLSESKTEAREVQRVAQGHTGRLPGLLSQSFSLLTQVSLGFWRFPSESSPPSGGHVTHVTRACFLVSSFNQPPPCHAPAAVNPASCSPGGRSAGTDGCVALPRVAPSLGRGVARTRLPADGRPWAGHRRRARERGRGGKEGQRPQEQG